MMHFFRRSRPYPRQPMTTTRPDWDWPPRRQRPPVPAPEPRSQRLPANYEEFVREAKRRLADGRSA